MVYNKIAPVTKVNKQQIKIIYTLAQGLGIVDKMVSRDSLHEMISSITGKEHVSDLTSIEATKVIDRLKGGMRIENKPQRNSPPSPSPTPTRQGMVSDGQMKKIWYLMFALKEYDQPDASNDLQKRLRGFLKKYARTDDIKFLTYQKANAVIEGLKGIIEREKAKAIKF
jgi:hypothetical protein